MINNTHAIAKLLWFSENIQRELILRQGDSVAIGRGDGNEIVLNSARVSRNHAQIEWNGENFIIRDLRSSNGTFVNGTQVVAMPLSLSHGDIVMIERIPMRFEILELPVNAQAINQDNQIKKYPQTSQKPRLIITEGPDIGREFLIEESQVLIGRESDHATWMVRLNDNAVSRPHAQIELEGDHYLLSDLGSMNGTTINGSMVIVPVIIKDGDVIEVGGSKLIYRL